MNGREYAIAFVLELAKRVMDTMAYQGEQHQEWEKVPMYRPKFIPKGEFSGCGIKRTELFMTNDDNKNILRILKLVYSLLQTISYENLEMDHEALRIAAAFKEKGEMVITLRLIDYRNNLQVHVTTITNKDEKVG